MEKVSGVSSRKEAVKILRVHETSGVSNILALSCPLSLKKVKSKSVINLSFRGTTPFGSLGTLQAKEQQQILLQINV